MIIKIKERRLRYLWGISQRELAEWTGLSAVSISNYETGKQMPNLKNALKIASVLECSIDDLYQEKDVMEELTKSGKKIRVVFIDGEPYFNGVDIDDVLYDTCKRAQEILELVHQPLIGKYSSENNEME